MPGESDWLAQVEFEYAPQFGSKPVGGEAVLSFAGRLAPTTF
jgi:hypothetical protein